VTRRARVDFEGTPPTPRAPAPGFPGLSVDGSGAVYGPSGTPLKRVRARTRGNLLVNCARGAEDGRSWIPVDEVVCSAFHGPKPSSDHWAKNLSGDMYDNRPENVAWVLKSAGA